jgi:pyruvate dehydrogenase E2 component (dihydrolipoamide acetyltransferase)
MVIPITIPRLGWNMEEGIFVGWLKEDGATIRAGDPLFSLESEKATEDIECLDAGILRIPPDGPQPGTKLAVGTVIGYLVAEGETAPFEAHLALTAASAGETTSWTPAVDLTPPTLPNVARGSEVRPQRRAISPRARRVARELGIDWKELGGSGRGGRIRERDIRAASAAEQSTRPQGNTLAVSSIRRTIAERMLTSHRSTAPVTLTSTADAANLVNLRSQFKTADSDTVPSYTDFLVKLTALALVKHPLLNSRWEGEQIVVLPSIHIGIAVDTDAGLLVPVIRDVGTLGLRQLAAQTRDLAVRARAGDLKAEELSGGTFTVTNLGAFDIDAFTPIINSPQCAILGVGRIERRPSVVGEQIVAREQMTLSLTFDHRIVDGAPAARFLQTLRILITNPGPALMP